MLNIFCIFWNFSDSIFNVRSKSARYLGEGLFKSINALLDKADEDVKMKKFFKSNSDSENFASKAIGFWKQIVITITKSLKEGSVFRVVFMSVLQGIKSLIEGILHVEHFALSAA